MLKPWAVSAAVFALLTIAGCGGSSDSSLGKAELIHRGDAICLMGSKKKDNAVTPALNKLVGKNSLGASGAEEEAVKILLEPIREMADRLGEMNPVDAQQNDIDAVVNGFKRAVAESVADPKAALKNDEAFVKPDQVAKAYGFKHCSTL